MGLKTRSCKLLGTHQHNANASLPHAAHKCEKNTNEKWGWKRVRAEFPRSLDDMLVDREQTYWWLKFGDVKGERESLILAAQDQALGTNYCVVVRRSFKQAVWVIQSAKFINPQKDFTFLTCRYMTGDGKVRNNATSICKAKWNWFDNSHSGGYEENSLLVYYIVKFAKVLWCFRCMYCLNEATIWRQYFTAKKM
jgi:hypothetical protein